VRPPEFQTDLRQCHGQTLARSPGSIQPVRPFLFFTPARIRRRSKLWPRVNRDSALMTRPRRLTAALRLSGAKNTFAPRGWNFNCATTAWMSCSRKSSMREWCEVCRYICLSVYQLVFLRNRIFELQEIFCACYSVAVVRRSSDDNICNFIRYMGSNKTLKNYKEKAEIQTNQSFTAFWHIQGDIGLQLTDRPIYLNSLQSPFLDAKYFRRPL